MSILSSLSFYTQNTGFVLGAKLPTFSGKYIIALLLQLGKNNNKNKIKTIQSGIVEHRDGDLSSMMAVVV